MIYLQVSEGQSLTRPVLSVEGQYSYMKWLRLWKLIDPPLSIDLVSGFLFSPLV